MIDWNHPDLQPIPLPEKRRLYALLAEADAAGPAGEAAAARIRQRLAGSFVMLAFKFAGRYAGFLDPQGKFDLACLCAVYGLARGRFDPARGNDYGALLNRVVYNEANRIRSRRASRSRESPWPEFDGALQEFGGPAPEPETPDAELVRLALLKIPKSHAELLRRRRYGIDCEPVTLAALAGESRLCYRAIDERVRVALRHLRAVLEGRDGPGRRQLSTS